MLRKIGTVLSLQALARLGIVTGMQPDHFRFPPGFLWGAATSAYQIEGSADVDGRAPSIWDTFAKTAGRVANGDTGDRACDSYRRVEEDVALLRTLGVQAYRFSISWSRVMPSGRGPLNPAGVDYYRRLVCLLREAGIQPMVTLYHWDLPQALQDEGGWTSRRCAHDFANYARAMFEALGDEVPVWFTINEPWCAAFLSYAYGLHAPGERDLARAVTVAHHLLLAHGLAVKEFRRGEWVGRIGIAPNVEWHEPYTQHPADVAACERGLAWFNRWFLDPLYRGRYPAEMLAGYAALGIHPPVEDGDMTTIAQPTDLLGINYYSGCYSREALPAEPPQDEVARQIHTLRRLESVDVPGFKKTDIDWNVYADGFYKVLSWIREEYGNPPVVITENGACDNTGPDAEGVIDDAARIEYFRRHVIALDRAVRAGSDLRGYMAWSLMDNFEWAYGYDMRFGLVHVDFETFARTPKESFHWYRRLIQEGGCVA
ncbi:beta-glucosidase [Rhizobacter sp. J219]|uniref:GH1 family beta-glucosidase n=1 Tax=Rhizobacter sp. J219 TaxID=2898430 RepID=UPI0021516E43|nr:GH1 family beta-glucosidase [Rhizobacter sp. J219]MCR5883292.1 beta-glucosidase [Rhizobacter sp. J219]